MHILNQAWGHAESSFYLADAAHPPWAEDFLVQVLPHQVEDGARLKAVGQNRQLPGRRACSDRPALPGDRRSRKCSTCLRPGPQRAEVDRLDAESIGGC